ncbi:MAG TPA: hypothetical protein ENO24_07520, partial [Chloroflexi bacterium]|nr:hypothetical protein [Chloroflexota bacterium]
MRTRLLAILLSVTIIVPFWASTVSAAEDPVVRFVVFEAQDCDHCLAVREEVLIPLSAEYGEQLEIRYFDIGATENYEVMVELEKAYGVSG